MSDLEMRKYRIAHAKDRNFASDDAGYGIVVAVIAVMAVCAWLVS